MFVLYANKHGYSEQLDLRNYCFSNPKGVLCKQVLLSKIQTQAKSQRPILQHTQVN